MNKIDLFRQIVWSQELIDHFVIVNDIDDIGSDTSNDIIGTVEATTTTIKYNIPDGGENINISIP